MAQRIAVPKTELEKIRKQLKKQQGLSLDKISDEIGGHYKNNLYRGITFDLDTFEKLQKLYGEEIKYEVVNHRNGVSYDKRVLSLTKNKDLAELFGMILGDGHIKDFSYRKENKYVTNYLVELTLHEDEKEIIDRAKRLVEVCTGRSLTYQNYKNNKGMTLRLYSKDVVDLLQQKGLKSGNKTKNQVGVPDWIKEDNEFKKACLKGLVDTDGTIYRRTHDGYKVVQFKNASKPLLRDFREMCEDLEISASKGGYRTIQVAAQDEVDKFIRLIQPIKAKGL